MTVEGTARLVFNGTGAITLPILLGAVDTYKTGNVVHSFATESGRDAVVVEDCNGSHDKRRCAKQAAVNARMAARMESIDDAQ